jgi:glycosyltransferase involved in cell wall biosynthesis
VVCSEFSPSAAGIGKYVEKLASSLASQGHEIVILTRVTSAMSLYDKLPPRISVERFKFLPLFPIGNIIMARTVEDYLAKNNHIDLLSIHTPAPIVINSSLPSVLTVHTVLGANLEPLGRGQGIPSATRIALPILAGFEKACLRTCKCLTAVSTSVADQLRATYKTENRQIDIVGNGVDLNVFTPLDEGNRERYILYAGRLHRGKRVDMLIEAFAEISEQHKDIELRIAGTGPQETVLRKLAANLRLQERVRFLGWLSGDQYVDTVRKACIFVLPSPNEGFSTVILEAMASGIAVIAADIPNNSVVIKNGYTGFLSRIGDVSDLADKISGLLEDESLKKRIEQHERVECESKFGWPSVADRFNHVMNSAIDLANK